jgi:hypothetical protein
MRRPGGAGRRRCETCPDRRPSTSSGPGRHALHCRVGAQAALHAPQRGQRFHEVEASVAQDDQRLADEARIIMCQLIERSGRRERDYQRRADLSCRRSAAPVLFIPPSTPSNEPEQRIIAHRQPKPTGDVCRRPPAQCEAKLMDDVVKSGCSPRPRRQDAFNETLGDGSRSQTVGSGSARPC